MEERKGWGRRLRRKQQAEAKTNYCYVCKKIQDQVRLEIKCFRKGREQWGRDNLMEGSIKILMAMAWVKIQMSKKNSYSEEEKSPRGTAGYKMKFEFTKEVTGNIKEKLSVPFLRHAAQQAIILENEHWPDIGHGSLKLDVGNMEWTLSF